MTTTKPVTTAQATSSNMAAKDRNIGRLGVLSGVCAKTNRILSGRSDLQVKVVQQGTSGAPSWTDGTITYLNADLIPALVNTSALVGVMGLSYHELSHILFSPRIQDSYCNTLQREGLFQTANLLEDQRIETLFTGLYPPAGAYFTEVVTQYIATKKQYEGAFVLTHGRRYLPVGLRSMLRKKYKHQGDVEALRRLIDEYRVLVYPRDQIDMLRITREVKKILTASMTKVDNPYGDCGGHISDGAPNGEAGESGSEGAAQSNDVEDTDDADTQPGESGEGDQSEGESEDGEDSDGSGGDDGDGGETGTGDADGDPLDGEGDGGEAGDGAGSGGGTGDGQVPDEPSRGGEEPPSDDEILDALDTAAESAALDDDIQQEVSDLKDTMNNQNNQDSLASTDEATLVDIQPVVAQTYGDVSRELQRIFAQYESGWERRVEAGRLNMNSVMQSIAHDGYVDADSAFDRWVPDQQDDIALEVVLLLDQSGSMAGGFSGYGRKKTESPISVASKALWTMKRALDDVDAQTTVIGFGSYAGTLYSRNDRAEKGQVRLFDSNKGGTSPWDALREANRILSGSDRPNKLLAIFTDGGWNSYDNYSTGERASVEVQDALIASMPWTTALFGIAMEGYGVVDSYGLHGCDIGGDVTDYATFVTVLRSLVTGVLKTVQ